MAAFDPLRTLRRAHHTLDAPKSEVRSRRIHGLGHASSRAVTPAIVGCAEMRAAFHHLAWNFDLRLGGVEALFALRAARVGHRAAWAVDLAMFAIPVRGPLPDIAGHVVEAIAVRRKDGHRRRAFETVFAQI